DSAAHLYSVSNFRGLRAHALYLLDAIHGTETSVVHTDLPQQLLSITDIAIRPEDGLAFVVVNSVSGNTLYTLNLATGTSTIVGSLNTIPSSNLTGLAFSPTVPEPTTIALIAIAVSITLARQARRFVCHRRRQNAPA